VIARDDTTAASPDARENEERGLRTAEMKAARDLAERYGGDPRAAAWRHYGRLAGFTNRKPDSRTPPWNWRSRTRPMRRAGVGPPTPTPTASSAIVHRSRPHDPPPMDAPRSRPFFNVMCGRAAVMQRDPLQCTPYAHTGPGVTKAVTSGMLCKHCPECLLFVPKDNATKCLWSARARARYATFPRTSGRWKVMITPGSRALALPDRRG